MYEIFNNITLYYYYFLSKPLYDLFILNMIFINFYRGCTKTIIYNYAQCSDYSCYYLMGTITTGAQDYVYLEKDINSDTQTWSKFYLGAPAAYSFAMDRDQSSIYYILNDSGTHLYFLSINTTNGALIFAYEDSSLSYMCNSDYCRVAISDNNKIP